MSTMKEVDPVLDWFKGEMRKKLAEPKNLRKEHWSKLGWGYLTKRLREESAELNDALLFQAFPTEEQTNKIISEAADVANFAMMIADGARKAQNGVVEHL